MPITYLFFEKDTSHFIKNHHTEYIYTINPNSLNFNLVVQCLQKTYRNIASTSIKVENLKKNHVFKKNEPLKFSISTENYFFEPEKVIAQKKTPLVSVILTAYNEEKTIEQSIDSIQNQTYSNLEIIIVDDCSSDSTLSVVKKMCQNDSRIKYYSMRNNSGTYYCRNYALSKASGDYVTFHDANDISRHDRVKKCLTHFEKNNSLDFVFSEYVRVDAQGFPIKNWYGSIYRTGLITLFIKLSSLKQKTGYFDLVKTSADSEFFERLQYLNLNYKKLNDVLYYARSQESSLTGSGLFKSFNKKGAFISNPIRRQYYINYKTYHRFSSKNNLYIKPFDYERNFLCPFNMLSPMQKNTLCSLINFKNNNNTYFEKKYVELINKNKLLKRKSLYYLLKQKQTLTIKKIHVILFLNNTNLLKHALKNYTRQDYENKYFVIIHSCEKDEISEKIKDQLNPNNYCLIKSTKKNALSLVNDYIEKKILADEIIAYFNENDFYFKSYLTEQSSVLNALPNHKIHKEPFLKYIKKRNSFVYLKNHKQLHLSKQLNNNTLCLTKKIWLEKRKHSFKENVFFSTSAFNYIKNFQLDSQNQILLDSIPRFI
ncbi:MAG TPA: glycosyltransferase family 2 protein [Oligoflexia bacterium]|nr:glycosyltransferase family 2 protein [Oligoflexia bacterium]HMR23804.1 glycosyltransferase family 2 protein [Oligoflexia bacterium]